MCFGGGDDSASREMINMQKAEADVAATKEAKRKKRIEKGLADVKAAFHGGPTTSNVSKTFTVPNLASAAKEGGAVAGLPAGYTYVRQPGTAAAAPVQGAAAPKTAAAAPFDGAKLAASLGASRANAKGTSANMKPNASQKAMIAAAQPVVAPNGEWMVRGPDGKLYKMGDKLGYQDTVTTNKADPTKGFLAGYEQDYLGNFLPQVATQFKDARDKTTYDLADAGTLQSSMAGDELAKLIEQNKINEADIRNKATSAVGDLRTRLQKEEDAANAAVMSVENPDVAAANAIHTVQNITAENAPNTMLGDIFKTAAIGGANYLKGARNASYRSQIPGARPATSIVG